MTDNFDYRMKKYLDKTTNGLFEKYLNNNELCLEELVAQGPGPEQELRDKVVGNAIQKLFLKEVFLQFQYDTQSVF